MKRILINIFDNDGAAISRKDITRLDEATVARLTDAVEARGFTHQVKVYDEDADRPAFLGGQLIRFQPRETDGRATRRAG